MLKVTLCFVLGRDVMKFIAALRSAMLLVINSVTLSRNEFKNSSGASSTAMRMLGTLLDMVTSRSCPSE